MKTFRFRLQTVLEHRERVEREKRGALARARARVLDSERALSEMQAAHAEAAEDARRTACGAVDVARARETREYLATLRRRMAGTRGRLRTLEMEFALRREEAVKARGERKVLAAFKSRLHVRHVRRMRRLEQAELDDVAQRLATR